MLGPLSLVGLRSLGGSDVLAIDHFFSVLERRPTFRIESAFEGVTRYRRLHHFHGGLVLAVAVLAVVVVVAPPQTWPRLSN